MAVLGNCLMADNRVGIEEKLFKRRTFFTLVNILVVEDVGRN